MVINTNVYLRIDVVLITVEACFVIFELTGFSWNGPGAGLHRAA